MTDYKKQGKANRAAGARFELKVRKDLEDKGWIVSKWMNNVEILEVENLEEHGDLFPKKAQAFKKRIINAKLITAKHKFRGPGIPMAIGTGFPDFEVRKEIIGFPDDKDIPILCSDGYNDSSYSGWVVIGVEVKSNGYLTKEEKEKCKWLLDSNIFSRIIIAKKNKKRGEIIYDEFK